MNLDLSDPIARYAVAHALDRERRRALRRRDAAVEQGRNPERHAAELAIYHDLLRRVNPDRVPTHRILCSTEALRTAEEHWGHSDEETT